MSRPITYLSEHDIRYIHTLIELGDQRKALTAVFGEFTPRKRHDEIMAKPLAQKKLQEIKAKAYREMDDTSAATLKRLADMDATNMGDLIDFERKALKSDIDPKHLKSIKSIKFDAKTGTMTQLTLVDPLRATEMKLKYHGLLNQKVDVNVHLSISEQLESDTVTKNDVAALLTNFKKSQETEIIGEIIEVEADEE